MRYTTVIDLTEFPEIWRNPNIARLYFFMALKCGYHDDDRDILRISLRNLAAQASLTISATRHALKVLESFKLVTQEKEAWRVTKFILDKKPTSRTQKNTAPMVDEALERQRQAEMKKEEETRKKGEFLHAASVEQCRKIIQVLKERGRSISVNGIVFYPGDKSNLEDWIKYKEKAK